MNSVKRVHQLITAVVMALSGILMADDGVWNQTAKSWSYEWNDAANWLPATGYPNGAGEFAGISNDIAEVQGILLREDITVGTLALGDGAATSYSYEITIQNGAGEDYALTFDSGIENVPAKIIMSKSAKPKSNLKTPINLNSDLLVDLTGVDDNNFQSIVFFGLMDMNDNDLIFVNGIYGQKHVTIDNDCDFTDGGCIINNSSSTINILGKKSYAGKLIANGKANGSNQSTFTLTDGGFTNVSEMVINGYFSSMYTREGGGIHSGSGSSHQNNPGQRLTRNKIVMNGGHLMQAANPAATSPGTNDWQMGLEWVRDEVATLELRSGHNYIGQEYKANTQGTHLDVGNLARQQGATVYIVGANNSDRKITADNGTAISLGSGGAAGTKNRSIVPWMTVFVSGGTGSFGGHGTYDATSGFRCLASGEYSTSITAGADHNVKCSNITLSSDTTVNSLYYDSWGDDNIGEGKTLTITSGGLIIARDRDFGKSGDATAGTVAFDTAEAVIWANDPDACVIGAAITGSGGLTKGGLGWLQLTGSNVLSGAVNVGAGRIQVGDGTYGSNLGDGDVSVHAGAVLQVSCADAIDDGATLTLFNIGDGLYQGSIELDSGINETVDKLYLGDEGMPSGTYGSTSSAATYQDDRYFSGDGVLTVTTSAGEEPEEEGGTVILLQ